MGRESVLEVMLRAAYNMSFPTLNGSWVRRVLRLEVKECEVRQSQGMEADLTIQKHTGKCLLRIADTLSACLLPLPLPMKLQFSKACHRQP